MIWKSRAVCRNPERGFKESFVRIRPGTLADVPEISRVYAESWKTTYEGIMPEPFIRGMTPEAAAKIFNESLQPNEYRYFFHVAEAPGGKLAGFADGGKERSHPERGIGELYAVYLLRECQRQGIGKCFFQAAVRSLLDSGMSQMVSWVVEQSPYRKFYESLGGKLGEGIKKIEAGGFQVRLVSYSWKDLNKIKI